MSGLAALLAGHTTPDVYTWHNAARVDDVAHAVEKADWRFAYLDGWTIEDKETFLKAAEACQKGGVPFGIGLGETQRADLRVERQQHLRVEVEADLLGHATSLAPIGRATVRA